MNLIINSYQYFKQEISCAAKDNLKFRKNKPIKGIFLFAKERQKNTPYKKKEQEY